ncbi:MAG: zinc ribbon domain-containing protein [Pseudomonadales bacterium]|jgi:putative FmdB family regulatory protein
MPIYAYRCRKCGRTTDHLAAVDQAPEHVTCEHCESDDTGRIISRVAYHASEASKTAKLDPKYDKMIDHAMNKSAGASEHRIIDKMKPFTGAKRED